MYCSSSGESSSVQLIQERKKKHILLRVICQNTKDIPEESNRVIETCRLMQDNALLDVCDNVSNIKYHVKPCYA